MMRRIFHAGLFGGRRRGAAMVEFVLMLPIMMFIVAFAIYLSLGLFKKQVTQTDVRWRLWHQVERHWWHHDEHSWPDWDGNANGPVGTGATSDSDRPRGTGDELQFFYDNAGTYAQGATANQKADDYFRRIWNNWPGRHHRGKAVEFETGSTWFTWLEGEVRTDYYHDSTTWTHGQEPVWLIAQYGPMLQIKTTFETYLADVPPEFRRMRDEVLHAWFKEEDLLSWNNPNAVIP